MIGNFHLQSSYSMLKSMIELNDLILECNKEEYEFIILTDEYLHGMYDYFKLTENKFKKVIIGMTVTILEPNENNFILIVKNEQGYRNLLELTYLKSQKKLNKIEQLQNHQEGLSVVLFGNLNTVEETLIYNDEETALSYLKKYKSLFDDFYFGLSFNTKQQRSETTNKLYNLSVSNGINVLLTNETYYLRDTDKEAYEALIKIEDRNNEVETDSTYKFLTKAQVQKIYEIYPRFKVNALDLIDKIEFNLNMPKFQMPIYKSQNNIEPKVYLKSLARVGLMRRLKINNITDDRLYKKRLEYELKIICDMDFESYFLIVYDFVRYAKMNDILVGPGRGSAAGSLVSYCLGITNIDPIKYDLMFERFLNPSRMTMPDIDLDFPDNKRDQVIDYVKEKYGENHICSISTYSKFAVRSSIRDIARVLNISTNRIDGIIQSIVNNRVDESDQDVMKLLNISSQIEGLIRQTGTHAAGIILSEQNLREHIPMQTGAFEFQQSQFEADVLEQMGLTKIDFLGIRNLTIISDIITNLQNKGINIDIDKIPLNDKKTFDLLSKGDTTGIFQLESSGMRSVLKKLKPNNFEDIVATLALYRPGPMENIDIYIERRNGKKFSYIHQDLEPILKKTYGIIVYQEQIMQIATTFAGYNLFEADMLRVGVSKKDVKILQNERNKFITKSMNKGYPKETAETIYNYILKFADYGFNRSHSVSYGLVAYQMAYLKAHYYEVFMSVLLSSVIGNESQTNLYINEIRNNNVSISPPNINVSKDYYDLINSTILMPLNSVKGLSHVSVTKILEEREKGLFKDYLDAKRRLNGIINEKQLENLIFAGAFDLFKHNRKTLFLNRDLEDASYAAYIDDFKMHEVEDFTYLEKSQLESDALGTNIKYNILNVYKNKYKNKNYVTIAEAKDRSYNGILGIISNYKKHKTKNGDTMLFLTISDTYDELEITVFPKEYKNYQDSLESGIHAFYVNSSMYRGEVKYNLIKMDILEQIK